MKFAIVDGHECEAQPKLRGHCRDCEAEVMAKCGTVKIWHWSHLGDHNCDHWQEPETPWHRNWKNEFPKHCQERRQIAPDGERHRADVKTESGTVLEFQYSAISSVERASREHFYNPMLWLVEGTHLKRDLPSFQNAIRAAPPIQGAILRLQLHVQDCHLLKRWAGSRWPVFVDFGEAKFDGLYPVDQPVLWQLRFSKRNNLAIATPIKRRSFIEHHRDKGRLRGYRPPPPSVPMTQQYGLPQFERYLRIQEARRPRF